MKGPFMRVCRKHQREIEDRTQLGDRQDTLWCPAGHTTRSWAVMDSLGETLAVCFMNEVPRYISQELAKIEIPKLRPPERYCSRGHFEWFIEGKGYRCRICRREQMLRKTQKAKEAK